MIYVVLYGRLGNNMWQISAAATVAKKLNTDFCAYIDPTYFCAEPDLCYLTDYVKQFRTTIFRKIKFVDTLPSSAIIVNECKLMEYDFKTDVDYVLRGYFAMQFDQEVALNLFEIDEVTKKYIYDKYPIIEGDVCSIVVRRGDYLKYLDDYAICGIGYYKRAIECIKKKGIVNFICISDDIDWCKENLSNIENIVFVEDENAIIDLYIPTLSKCNIISNSSFAIWGAKLSLDSDKFVIIPSPWFGYARQKMEIDMQRGLPDNWIRIYNKSLYYYKGMFIYMYKKLKEKTRSIISIIR